MTTIDNNTALRIYAWPDSAEWPLTGLQPDPEPGPSPAMLRFYEHAIERLSGLDREYRPGLWGAMGDDY